MVINRNLKVRGADMTGIALGVREHVIDRLWRRTHARSKGVATGTHLWRVLENALDVALFALESVVDISQYESGF
jgi:hypothetical protein